MRTSDEGICALMQHEGIVPAPYLDSVNVWTYGIGHTKSAGEPNPELMGKGMPSDLDAELQVVFDVFREDIKKYEALAEKAITVNVEQHEFDALVSFIYNTGATTATWIKTLNSGNRELAAQQIMNWTKPPEIIPRRTSEQVLFRDGIYPTDPITVWKVSDSGKVIWSPARSLSHDDALSLMHKQPNPTPKPETRPSRGIHQSNTLRASFGAMFASIGSAVTAFSALDSLSQYIVLGFAGIGILMTVWIARERIKKWGQGYK
jgi:lysozyme